MRAALVIALLTSCGQAHRPQVSIDPELQPYFYSFVNSGISQAVVVDATDIIIQFGVLDTPMAAVYGKCNQEFNATPTVTIDKKHWDSGNEQYKESLVYHELGHCLLGRGHTAVMMAAPDGTSQPASIMYPNSTIVAEYLELRQYYIKELFQGAKQ